MSKCLYPFETRFRQLIRSFTSSSYFKCENWHQIIAAFPLALLQCPNALAFEVWRRNRDREKFDILLRDKLFLMTAKKKFESTSQKKNIEDKKNHENRHVPRLTWHIFENLVWEIFRGISREERPHDSTKLKATNCRNLWEFLLWFIFFSSLCTSVCTQRTSGCFCWGQINVKTQRFSWNWNRCAFARPERGANPSVTSTLDSGKFNSNSKKTHWTMEKA